MHKTLDSCCWLCWFVCTCELFAGCSGVAGAAVSGQLSHGLLCQWQSWPVDR